MGIYVIGQTQDGEWVKGYPILDSKHEYSFILEFETTNGEPTPVLPESVRSFTGLYDKNKTMIFHGSIVKQVFENEVIYSKVVYECGAYGLKELRNGCEDDEPLWFCTCGDDFTESELEVVGNVFDQI